MPVFLGRVPVDTRTVHAHEGTQDTAGAARAPLTHQRALRSAGALAGASLLSIGQWMLRWGGNLSTVASRGHTSLRSRLWAPSAPVEWGVQPHSSSGIAPVRPLAM